MYNHYITIKSQSSSYTEDRENRTFKTSEHVEYVALIHNKYENKIEEIIQSCYDKHGMHATIWREQNKREDKKLLGIFSRR